MKQAYTEAFLATLNSGVLVHTAIDGLRSAMQKRRHAKLFGPVLLEAVRILESRDTHQEVKVFVATGNDIAVLKSSISEALKTLQVPKHTPIREAVDETLIGGFVATFNYKEYDASYKKSLKSLYESIIK